MAYEEPHRIGFVHVATTGEQLEVGDAVRWTGFGVWRVEDVAGDRVTLRLWPDNEPYSERINEFGPGDWPDSDTAA
ncbi:MAG: hypothetical protein ABI948_05105 [Thermoleophilia bacterium]